MYWIRLLVSHWICVKTVADRRLLTLTVSIPLPYPRRIWKQSLDFHELPIIGKQYVEELVGEQIY